MIIIKYKKSVFSVICLLAAVILVVNINKANNFKNYDNLANNSLNSASEIDGIWKLQGNIFGLFSNGLKVKFLNNTVAVYDENLNIPLALGSFTVNENLKTVNITVTEYSQKYSYFVKKLPENIKIYYQLNLSKLKLKYKSTTLELKKYN